MKVAKFGGTSMADANSFQRVATLIGENPDARVIAVSAGGTSEEYKRKITDLLIDFKNGESLGISRLKAINEIERRLVELESRLKIKLNILYLAVNDKIRSKGYGSAILQCIKQRFSNKAIALNIEPLDPKSDNYAQRIKRFEFYLKNGFVDTHYQILATTTQFPIKEYKLTIKQLSFGLYSPQIKEHTN